MSKTVKYILGSKVLISDKTPEYRGSFNLKSVNNEEGIERVFNLICDKKTPVLFDIGACTGSYTLLQTLKKDIIVHSFEPSRAFSELKENVKLNGVVVVLNNMAVSSYEGVGSFNEISDDGCIALSMLDGSPAQHKTFNKKAIEVTTIDAYCKESSIVPGIIKIDTEGNELFVLQGAKEIIEKHHPIIYAEYSYENTIQYGYNPHVINDFLIECGYETKIFDTDILATWTAK